MPIKSFQGERAKASKVQTKNILVSDIMVSKLDFV